MGGVVIWVLRLKKNLSDTLLEQVFFSTLLGLISLVTVYAIVITNFHTVNNIFLIWFVLLFFSSKYINKKAILEIDVKKDIPHKLDYFWLLVGTFVIFCWCFFSIYSPEKEFSFFAASDYIFNSNIAFYIRKTGEENEFHILNTLSPIYNRVTPYHYFELWLNSLLSKITQENSIFSFYLQVIPMLYWMGFLGFSVLIRNSLSLENRSLTFLISALGFVFTGFYFPFFDSYLGEANVYLDEFSLSMFTYNKYKIIYYYIFILAGFILIQKRQLSLAILFLLALPVATFTSLPSIVGGIALFILIRWFINKNDTTLLSSILSTTIISGAIGLFYIILGNKELGREGTDINSLVSLLDIQKIIPYLKVFLGGNAILLFLYSPIIIITAYLLLNRKMVLQETDKIILGIGATIVLVGLMTWTILNSMANSVQLFQNIGITIFNVLSILMLVRALNYGLKRKYLGYTILLFLIFVAINSIDRNLDLRSRTDRIFGNYSYKYIEDVRTFLLEREEIPLGASIRGNIYYSEKDPASFYNSIYTAGNYLSFLQNGQVPISISDFNGQITTKNSVDRNRMEQGLKLGIFFQYVLKQKESGSFQSVEKSQIDFILKHDIQYIIANKEAEIPPRIVHLIKKRLDDSISGDSFLILVD